MELISNIALTLRGFKNACLAKQDNLNMVYSHNATYKDDIVEMRGEHVLKDKVEDTYNLLAYKRDVLKWATTHRAAKASPIEYDIAETKVKVYKSWYGEIGVDFIFYSPSPKDIDNFEIQYHTETSITGIDEFYVDLTNIGLDRWTYQCIWDEEMKSVDFIYNDVYYKAIKGRVIINGQYLLFSNLSGRIETINLDIFSYDGLLANPNNPILSSKIIT
jgi:hypothetical protein